MKTLLSYKSIPFNVKEGYILIEGEENLPTIEALLVANEIEVLENRYDILLINDPMNFLDNFYKPVQNSPEEEAKIISINPSIDELTSKGKSLRDIYEDYKPSPIYLNASRKERDVYSRIEILILRNLGLNVNFIIDLAEISERKGIKFYESKIANQLKDFILQKPNNVLSFDKRGE